MSVQEQELKLRIKKMDALMKLHKASENALKIFTGHELEQPIREIQKQIKALHYDMPKIDIPDLTEEDRAELDRIGKEAIEYVQSLEL